MIQKFEKESPTQVLYFSAAWCAPCKALKTTLEAMDYTFVEVDVDDKEGANIASKYGVRGIPTLVFVKDGKQVDLIVGAVPRKQIEDSLKCLGA